MSDDYAPEDFNDYVIDVFQMAILLFDHAPREYRIGADGWVVSDFNELEAHKQEEYLENARKWIKHQNLPTLEEMS